MCEWQCVDGTAYLPQSRKRVFIVGYLDSRCAGEILPLERKSGAPLSELTDRASQGNRVYDAKGSAITLTASCGGFGGKTGMYFVDMNESSKITDTARCDINGIVLGYSVHPGNENDGKTFPDVFKKIEHLNVEVVVGDSAYKTPAIAKHLKDRRVKLLSTYTRPKTKDGFFPKYEYVYDETFDCYICPANQILSYSTTNRDGYREYKSNPKVCENCPHLNQCTHSQAHEKVVTRHVWQEAWEEMDENRYTYGIKDLYKYRKETIERIFALAKELHGFRYTQELGKAQMDVEAALTYTCLNLKKLAKKRWKTRPIPSPLRRVLHVFFYLFYFHTTNPLPA